LKTCESADEKNGVMQFTNVKISNGIQNTDSIKTSGIFTCENPGLYLIAVYMTTNTKHGRYAVYKNTVRIAGGYSVTASYETTSVTVIEHLTVNDTISVTGSMSLVYGTHSCLTILQIK